MTTNVSINKKLTNYAHLHPAINLPYAAKMINANATFHIQIVHK